MNDALKFLSAVYCSCEYALEEHRALLVSQNDHTILVEKRAMKTAATLADIIEENNYKIIMYTNDYFDNNIKSTLHPSQPLYYRGVGYFKIPSGGIVFINNSDNKDLFYPDPQGVRLSSGRFQSSDSFDILIQEIIEASKFLK
ncbi:hypothetical protein ABRP56_09025 [Pectobacterium odoriferum]|uniref:hypothetical protein n=1 Tax=Pectobacterium odoriferum TaxID=78398 RepID=UPI0032EC36B8